MHSGRRFRAVVAVLTISATVGLTASLAVPASAVSASTITVTTTADTGTNCTAPTPGSLRAALCQADQNAVAGTPTTITVPAGTYALGAELTVATGGGSGPITVTGAGAGATTITPPTGSRAFDVDPSLVGGTDVTVQGLTISGGSPTSAGGGAIADGSSGGPLDTLTLIGVTITGAHSAGTATTNQPGGAVLMDGGALTVTGSTFTDNTSSASSGGAIAMVGEGAGDSLTVSGSAFVGNTASATQSGTSVGGGAIDVEGTGTTTTSITGSTFRDDAVTNPSGTAASGGAVWIGATGSGSGTTRVNGNAFLSNSATTGGSAIAVAGPPADLTQNVFVGNSGSTISGTGTGTGAVTATDSWWGTGAGPQPSAVTGSVTTAPWITFSAAASPSTVTGPGGSSTITAGFTTDSAGGAVPTQYLSTLFADGTAVTGTDQDTGMQVSPGTLHSGAAQLGLSAPAAFTGATTVIASTSGTFSSASAATTVQYTGPPAFTSPAAATFTTGTAGSFAVTTSGTPSPTVALTSGTLPAGLTLAVNGGTATISGTPTGAGGSTTVGLTATSSAGTATQTLTVLVQRAPAFTSATTATFESGSAGSFVVGTSGYPAPTIATGSQLPAGLVLVDGGDGTATISGSPSVPGTTTVQLTATNGVDPAATQTLTIVVDRAASVTTQPTSRTVSPGTATTFTATVDGYPAPSVTWEISADGGTDWRSVTAQDGAVSTTSTDTSTATDLTVQATTALDRTEYRVVAVGSAGPVVSAAATLRVGTAPTISSAPSAVFVAGAQRTFTITTSGTPAATVAVDGLPSWLSFTPTPGGGVLTGAPTAADRGTSVLTVTATNDFAPTATQSLVVEVDASPTITSGDAAGFVAGAVGSFDVTTTDGYPTGTGITEQGALPQGLSLRDDGDGTATLAGTPAPGTGGTSTVTLVATPLSGAAPAATQTLTITVDEAASFTTPATATFRVGDAGSFPVVAAGGFPSTGRVHVVGDLPAGLTFVDAGDGTGTIVGTPAAGTAGVSTVTLVSASTGTAGAGTQVLTIVVDDVPAITSPATGTFSVGTAGSLTVTTAPGHPTATTITVSGAPGWMTVTDHGDGTATLTGVPPVGSGGPLGLEVTAANTIGSVTQHLALTVAEQGTVTTTPTPTVTAGEPADVTIGTANVYPAPRITLDTTSPDDLPAGLTFVDNGDGTASITGTATRPAIATLTVVVDNGIDAPIAQTVTLTVDGPPTLTSAAAVTATVGTPFSFEVTAANGVPVVTTLTATGLPDGFVFTRSVPAASGPLLSVQPLAALTPLGTTTGTIAGTPTASEVGTHRITVTASNGDTSADVQTIVLTVVPAAATGSGGTGTPGSGTSGSGSGSGSVVGSGATSTSTAPAGSAARRTAAVDPGSLAFTGGTFPWDWAALAVALLLAGLVLGIGRRLRA